MTRPIPPAADLAKGGQTALFNHSTSRHAVRAVGGRSGSLRCRPGMHSYALESADRRGRHGGLPAATYGEPLARRALSRRYERYRVDASGAQMGCSVAAERLSRLTYRYGAFHRGCLTAVFGVCA